MQYQPSNEIQSLKIKETIQSNVQCIEKLEKGDKTLVSPNLEISPHNLKIVKFRLHETLKHLDVLRESAKKEPELIQAIVKERAEFMESLIFDIKNPSDYLPLSRRIINNLFPFIVCYYLIAVPLVIFSSSTFLNKLEEIASIPLYSKLIIFFLTTSLIPAYFSFLWWAFHKIRDHLIISSFKFKRSQYKKIK